MFTNVWYVAERSANVAAEPVKVRMLGCDFVLFRDTKGQVACLSNVCPHRGANLAGGRCRDDGTLACPYHGWRFNRDGQCVRIPSQTDPDAVMLQLAKVDSYPVREQNGLIWVFLGDEPEAASPPLDIPEVGNAAYRQIDFNEVWNCNYERAVEIDLDYVHSHFVHGAWGEEHRARPPDHVVEDFSEHGFASHLIARSQPNRGIWRFLRKEGKGVPSYLKFKLPGFCRRVQVFIGGEGSPMHFVFYHFATPINAEQVQNRLLFFRSFLKHPFFDKTNIKRNERAIREDRKICEEIFPKAPAAARDWEIQTEHDHLVGAFHRILGFMRAKGWQIDTAAMDEMAKANKPLMIPSPARRQNSAEWAFPTVPRIAPHQTMQAKAAELGLRRWEARGQ
ncbi:MAG: aromatic ring-hydroxylating dioxygenase subunit alpha [Rhodospirillaceae bacterium]|nr:aromatic ring-hydroxylating dioxygenase subunit alpha [Rhodospirillaceae bacterium]